MNEQGQKQKLISQIGKFEILTLFYAKSAANYTQNSKYKDYIYCSQKIVNYLTEHQRLTWNAGRIQMRTVHMQHLISWVLYH